MKKTIDNPYTLGFLLAILLVVSGLYVYGWVSTWSFLHIPTMFPPYADMRSVQGGLASLAHNYDPQVANPGDPWGRPMNYPMIWIHIASWLSLHKEPSFLLAVTITVLLYLAVCYRLLDKHPSPWLLLATLSGSSLLAVERGNNDLVIFTLSYLVAALPYAWLGAILIVIGTGLKVYPAFSVLALHKNWRALLTATLGTAVVIYWNYDGILKIREATPISAFLSYGAPSISLLLQEMGTTSISSVVVALGLSTGAIMTYSIPKLRLMLKTRSPQQNEQQLFAVGASLYVCTFIFSSNWDYRLIFSVFCIPYCLLIINRYLRYALLVAIILASNQLLLIGVAEITGGLLNVAMKAFVFSVFLTLLLKEGHQVTREYYGLAKNRFQPQT